MIERICKECGKTFSVMYESNPKKFCSKTCSLNNSWKNGKRKKAEYVEIKCKCCGKTFSVMACETRVKKGEINFCSTTCRDNARKSGINKSCLVCGKMFYTTRNKFCSQDCAREYRKNNYQHKTYIENGYIVCYKNGYNKKGNVKMHRLIMEEHLGRKLGENEIVHHIDGNKKNNNIENLSLMARGEHSSYHRKQEIENGKKLFTKIN